MKSRSKRNRKRPRGGIGCLMGDGKDNNDDEDINKSLLQIETIQLSTAFKIISDSSSSDAKQSNDVLDANTTAKDISSDDDHQRRRIRIIYPYPFSFATFAKQRWLGRSIVDIYNDEFGSYPRSYYESAIESGRILVSGQKVSCDYKVKGGDELTHTVHRHEPAVALADDITLKDSSESTTPPINIVYEDDTILVVDKPATLPIHPCGGYNFNSLFEILSHWKPDKYGQGKLFTIHRLDRLTSGLVVIAKSSAIARELSKCISERDGCEKIYLARVKGKFPLGLQSQGVQNGDNNIHPWEFRLQSDTASLQNEEADYPNKRRKCLISPPCQSGEVLESETDWKGGVHIPIINNEGKKKKQNNDNTKETYAGLGYWMTNRQGEVVENACSLQDLIDQSKDISIEKAIGSSSTPDNNDNNNTSDANESLLWLNFACPCRISSHKNGVCEAGCFTDLKDESDRKSIKPAQTSFILLSYDASSDTSLVLARPENGRTHQEGPRLFCFTIGCNHLSSSSQIVITRIFQIRLHLQKLGHPIANDHNYGGELWFRDEEGKAACKQSRDWLNQLDKGTGGTATNVITPQDSTNADTPATEAEIYHAAANRKREDGESILDYIQNTCVFCARCYGLDCLKASDDTLAASKQKDAVLKRTMMEYLVRSQGIWLHALQYSLKTTDDGNKESKSISYRTDLPSWAK